MLRARLPRRTVRLRLTLVYGGLFFVSGSALLAITYVLVRHSTGNVLLFRTKSGPNLSVGTRTTLPSLPNLPASTRQLRELAAAEHAHELHQLLVQSAIALGIMMVVSIALGWLVVGRALRPLRAMTATTRRISEHNLHERLALQGPSDELKDLGDTIDELLARLEAAFEAQRRFVANASHELRTPLAMMRTSLDVATGKPGTVAPAVSSLGDKLREGLDQADRLLESFLTLARAQGGAIGEAKPVALAPAVAAALAVRRDAIDALDLDVRIDLDAVEVQGSETLLARMVANVVDNAIRHNAPGGFIDVETAAGDDAALLVVRSSGRRLDAADVAELAQPFRRLGAERTGSENGFGLGLSIVAAIAAAHGGSLDLRARPDGGLDVRIELPYALRALDAGAPA